MVFPEALGRHVRTSLFPRLGIISLQLKCIRYVVHGREWRGGVSGGPGLGRQVSVGTVPRPWGSLLEVENVGYVVGGVESVGVAFPEDFP